MIIQGIICKTNFLKRNEQVIKTAVIILTSILCKAFEFFRFEN